MARVYRCQLGVVSGQARDALRGYVLVADAVAEPDGELAELLIRHHVRAEPELNTQGRA